MAFADQQSLKERSAGMAGAVIIPAALGAIFISGLAVDTLVTIIEDRPFEGTNVEIDLPPPPPPKKIPEEIKESPVSQVTAPDTPFEFPKPDIVAPPIKELPPFGGETIPIVVPPIDSGPALGSIKPAVAAPRNNPGGWVTESDYRTIWINRGWTGVARFELQVSARGRVTNCQITRSTGHSALDQATCKLIAKRARFEPATDSAGQAVSGTYSNAISWELPD